MAVAEMVARSGVGAHLARVPDHRALFGEGPSRVLCCVDPERLTEVLAAAEAAGVPTTRIGLATGDRLIVKGLLNVAVDEVAHAYRDRLPEALGAGTTNR